MENAQLIKDPVVLSITMHPDGQLDVTGPIRHPALAIYMLELAKRLVMDYKPEAQATPLAAL